MHWQSGLNSFLFSVKGSKGSCVHNYDDHSSLNIFLRNWNKRSFIYSAAWNEASGLSFTLILKSPKTVHKINMLPPQTTFVCHVLAVHLWSYPCTLDMPEPRNTRRFFRITSLWFQLTNAWFWNFSAACFHPQQDTAIGVHVLTGTKSCTFTNDHKPTQAIH